MQRPLSFLGIDLTPKNPGFDPLFPTAPVDPDDPSGLGRIAEMALLKHRSTHGGICHEMTLKNKYFSANLPVWIDEFSYFKRPLNALALASVTSNSNESTFEPLQSNQTDSKPKDANESIVGQNTELHSRKQSEGLAGGTFKGMDSKDTCSKNNVDFQTSPGNGPGLVMRGMNNSEQSLNSSNSTDQDIFVDAVEKEDDFYTDELATKSAPNANIEISQGNEKEGIDEISFLEDTKTWVDAYCSDEQDVRMVRDSLLAIIYTFDSVHPYPESLQGITGPADLAAVENTRMDLGSASIVTAGTNSNTSRPSSLAESDVIGLKNKQILEQRHLNAIEIHIKELLRLVGKLEDEEWGGLFMAICKDIRTSADLDLKATPGMTEQKDLTHSIAANTVSISNPQNQHSVNNVGITITPPSPQKRFDSKGQSEKTALENAHRVTEYINKHLLNNSPYEVINLNEGPDYKTFSQSNTNRIESEHTGSQRDAGLCGLNRVEMVLNSLVTFSATDRQDHVPAAKYESLRTYGTGRYTISSISEIPVQSDIARTDDMPSLQNVISKNTIPVNSSSLEKLTNARGLQMRKSVSKTVCRDSITNLSTSRSVFEKPQLVFPTVESLSLPNENISELSKEIRLVYAETVNRKELQIPLFNSSEFVATIERNSSKEIGVESARRLHGTEGLVQQLRDFRLNVDNMTLEEAQRSLDKISVDMSRFL